MKLIVGLGNPGIEYEHNRHNVGTLFLDHLTKAIDSSSYFTKEHKLLAELNTLSINGEKYLFAKPQTYMNLSGKPVQKIMAFYKIHPDHIFVAHDDLDIPLGKFKIQQATGPKLHNGLSSIEEVTGTKDFYRIRIGVENRTGENRVPGETYVLQDFLPEEQAQLPPTFEKVHTLLSQLYFAK